MREADDRIQRRAQLMAHIGQELGLGPVRQLRRLFRLDQRRFGLLAVGDVQRHRHHMGDAAKIVAHGRFGGQEDALHALRGDEHLLEAGRRVTGLEYFQIQGQRTARIVVVQQLHGGLAGRLVRSDPEQIGLVRIDEGIAARGGRGADHRRHRVDHPEQPLVAFPERPLVLVGLTLDTALQGDGALVDQLLVLPQGQEVARSRAELVMVDRRQQKVGRAGIQRRIAEAAVFVGGDHHDRDVGAVRDLAELADEIRAVHLRHLEIGDDQIRDVGFRPGQRVPRVGKLLDGGVFLQRRREPGQDFAVRSAVVYNSDDRHWPAILGRDLENAKNWRRSIWLPLLSIKS